MKSCSRQDLSTIRNLGNSEFSIIRSWLSLELALAIRIGTDHWRTPVITLFSIIQSARGKCSKHTKKWIDHDVLDHPKSDLAAKNPPILEIVDLRLETLLRIFERNVHHTLGKPFLCKNNTRHNRRQKFMKDKKDAKNFQWLKWYQKEEMAFWHFELIFWIYSV